MLEQDFERTREEIRSKAREIERNVATIFRAAAEELERHVESEKGGGMGACDAPQPSSSPSAAKAGVETSSGAETWGKWKFAAAFLLVVATLGAFIYSWPAHQAAQARMAAAAGPSQPMTPKRLAVEVGVTGIKALIYSLF